MQYISIFMKKGYKKKKEKDCWTLLSIFKMLLVIASILPFPYILGTMEAIKTRMSFIVVLCSSYGANKKQKQIFLCPLVYNYNEWLSISSNYQESTNNIFKNAIDYSVFFPVPFYSIKFCSKQNNKYPASSVCP